MANDDRVQTQVHNAWSHRIAVILCCATFPLIWVGGLVTTYDAGMAVPDWPSTYGYNLFAYPWKTWLFGPFDLFIEHGHRLLGAAVGLLAIGLVVAVFSTDRRLWMRFAAMAMLGFVFTQGVFGGVRVRLDERGMAMIHACFGLATFALSAAIATVTSRSWNAISDTEAVSARSVTRLLRIAAITAALTYVQVILGALLRHFPVAAASSLFRAAVWFHILCGLAVVIHVVVLAIRAREQGATFTLVRRRVCILSILVFCQVGLGVSTWVMKYGWPAWFANQLWAANFTIQTNSLSQALITTLHMAVGALILALSVVICLRVARIRSLSMASCDKVRTLPQRNDGDRDGLIGRRTATAILATHRC